LAVEKQSCNSFHLKSHIENNFFYLEMVLILLIILIENLLGIKLVSDI